MLLASRVMAVTDETIEMLRTAATAGAPTPPES